MRLPRQAAEVLITRGKLAAEVADDSIAASELRLFSTEERS